MKQAEHYAACRQSLLAWKRPQEEGGAASHSRPTMFLWCFLYMQRFPNGRKSTLCKRLLPRVGVTRSSLGSLARIIKSMKRIEEEEGPQREWPPGLLSGWVDLVPRFGGRL